MSTFGERLNQWLEEQGRAPWPQYMLDALDKAAAETAVEMTEHEKEIVAFAQEAMAEWQRQAPEAQEKEHGNRSND